MALAIFAVKLSAVRQSMVLLVYVCNVTNLIGFLKSALMKTTNLGWEIEVECALLLDLPKKDVSSVISLINNDNTLPFVARYRQTKTGNMSLENLRKLWVTYEELKKVHKRATIILKQLSDLNICDDTLIVSTMLARSEDDLDLIATNKELKLDSYIEKLFKRQINFDFWDFEKNELLKEAFTNRIYTDNIHKMANIITNDNVKLISIVKKGTQKTKIDTKHKYESYFNFSANLNNIKPYQTLALLRGEAQKVLNLRLEASEWCKRKALQELNNTYSHFVTIQNSKASSLLRQMLSQALDTKIIPQLLRKYKLRLKRTAQESGIEMFAQNLRNILLVPPHKGVSILGVDPGYAHGCKIAMISPLGHVLTTDVMYLNRDSPANAKKLLALLSSHHCHTIALGNGKGRQEFEAFLGNHILSIETEGKSENATNDFDVTPLRYYVVDERGSSHYSVALVDKDKEQWCDEFGVDMDPKMKSAVSIARRLQDPLNELVKVDPKNLGIGMYQHDMPKAQLEKALNGIVEECVSFVGVDLNTCSPYLLSRVAGLNSTRARAIIEYRKNCNQILNRNQLQDIKGIGKKTFEQCAGFVKILPSTIPKLVDSARSTAERPQHKKLKTSRPEYNPLDSTIIHPDSYGVAEKLLKELNFSMEHIGQRQHAPLLAVKITNYLKEKRLLNNNDSPNMIAYECLASQNFDVDGFTLKIVLEALQTSTNQYYDYREENGGNKPIARTSILKASDIRPGLRVSGTVNNVTDFGLFIDCALPHSVFVHKSQTDSRLNCLDHLCALKTGDTASVEIVKYDPVKKQIAGRLL